MAAQKGSDMLLKIDTAVSGGPTYTTVGGGTATSIRINEGAVDVTNQGSPNKWQQLLAGAGIKKVSISMSGIFDDDAGINAVLTSKMNGTHKDWQITVPGLGAFTGKFLVSSLDIKGPHDREVAFDISLDSAGEITFTTA